MKKAILLATIGLGLWACEEIPDCAYNESCAQELPNLSKADFSNEPYTVMTMPNRDKLEGYFQVYRVESPYRYPEGTIVVDTPKRVLYLIEEQGLARRYPIAVGKEGSQFEGQAQVGRMVKWPLWYPTQDMKNRNPNLPDVVKGGAQNPLGARAIYLYDGGRDTLYRIHGNNEPRSIGREASSGCIRMYNEDVIDLYSRVDKNTNVVVIGAGGAEEEHIGNDVEPVEERPLSTWEEMFYSFRNGSSTTAKPAPQNEPEAEVQSEGFDLVNWLQSNAPEETVE